MLRFKKVIWVLGVIAAVFLFGSQVKAEDYVVVIDPGHGGKDAGAYRSFSRYEKEYNYKIAKYCKTELEKYNGIRVYLTRTSDKYLYLDERAQIAQNYGADLFVSLHNNSSISSAARGAEVYITQNNTSIEFKQGMTIFGNYVLDNLQKLGIQRRSVSTRDLGWGYYSFGGRHDYYGVIRGGISRKIPSCIVEHTFVSNQSDVKSFLKSNTKLKKLGTADAKAILKYSGLKDAQQPKAMEINTKSATLYPDEVVSLTAEVIPYSEKGKGVKWNSSDSKIAAVDKDGHVFANAAGKAVITGSSYNGLKVTCSITVREEKEAPFSAGSFLKFSSSSQTLGMGINYQVLPMQGGAEVQSKNLTFKSSNSLVAAVDKDGKVTPLKNGTAYIMARNKNGTGKTARYKVTVRTKTTSLKLSSRKSEMVVGESGKLKVTVNPAKASGKVKWISSNTKRAVVSQSGNVSAKGAGKVTITAVSGDGSKQQTVTIPVYSKPKKISVKTIYASNQKSVNLKRGKSYQIRARVSPAKAKQDMTWKSSNSKVIKVNSKGKVKAIRAGSATVTVTARGTKVKKKISFKVIGGNVKAKSIKAGKKSYRIKNGEKIKISTKITPANTTASLKYSSNKKRIVTIDKYGYMTGRKKGKAKITIKTGNGKKASVTVRVK